MRCEACGKREATEDYADDWRIRVEHMALCHPCLLEILDAEGS